MNAFINTVIWAAIFQGFLLGCIYTFSKRPGSKANLILGAFLFALVIEAIGIFLPLDAIGQYSINDYFTLPEIKIFLPLLFFHFVMVKVGGAKKYQTILKIHYGLGALVLSLTLINLLLFVFMGSSLNTLVGEKAVVFLFFLQQYYAFFLSVVAFVISVRETSTYHGRAKNEYSDIEMLEINWLWQFIFLILPVIILWGAELVTIIFNIYTASNLVLFTWGAVVIFIYFISFKAFQQKNLLEGSPSVQDETLAPIIEKDEEKLHEEISAKLHKLMLDKKFYLNQDLTIYELAKKTGISARQISASVNRHLGINFSQWVNNYRVDESLTQMKITENQYLSIEGIGANAGFKSRSAMYTAFKKKTGKAPGNFKHR